MGPENPEKPLWVVRYARTIFFFTLALASAGLYLSFQIPSNKFSAHCHRRG
jgi:hypothetical protein